LWARDDLVRHYADRELRPPEILILAQHRGRLSGRVLELGPGGGRVTSYLVQLGADVLGIDISHAMVDYVRSAIPGGTFEVGDLRDLSAVPSASHDAVVAANNVLDVTSWDERPQILADLHRILAPGGKLIMSSHNRAAEHNLRRPTQIRWKHPAHAAADLWRLPRRWRNRRRVLPYERRERDWAVLNDVSHDFEALHLYVRREAQVQQLVEAGFELLECLDTAGRPVGPSEDAPEHEELYYVAARI
jgi:SAM-dependent methyltransferase